MSKIKELFLNKIFGIISVSAVLLYFISFKIFNNNTLSLIASGGCNTTYTTGNIIVDTINVYLGRFVLSGIIAGLMFLTYVKGMSLIKTWILSIKDTFSFKKEKDSDIIYLGVSVLDLVPENNSFKHSFKFYWNITLYCILDFIREKFVGIGLAILSIVIGLGYIFLIPGATKECSVSLISGIIGFSSTVFILVSIAIIAVASYPYLNSNFNKVLPSLKDYLNNIDYNISWHKIHKLVNIWYGQAGMAIEKYIKKTYNVDYASIFCSNFRIDILVNDLGGNRIEARFNFYDTIDSTTVKITVYDWTNNGITFYSENFYFQKDITIKQVLDHIKPIYTKETELYLSNLPKSASEKVDEKMAELEIAINENLINPN